MLKIHTPIGTIIATLHGTPIEDTLPEEYADILRFNMVEVEQNCVANHTPLKNEMDITELGYWIKDGTYVNSVVNYPSYVTDDDYYGACNDQ